MSETTTHTRGRGRGRGGSSRGRGGPANRGGVAAGPSSSSSAIPSGSVSKIKAQLRQTKRLLAKDDLNPDVRVTSERRLAALEDELVKAEKGLLEKKMVTKYRGIKFFERQKVLRRIKQAKKQVEQGEASDATKEQLKLARLDLYYILRYPKTEKYLALYPENSYIPYTSTPPASSSTGGSSITPSDPSSSTKASKAKAVDSDQKRWELRTEILKKVDGGEWNEESERGDLGIEGEEDVEIGATTASKAGEKRSRTDDGEDEAPRDEAKQDEGEDKTTPAKKRKVAEEPTETTVVAATAGDAAGEAEAAEEGGEPKKLNRKQKKALRRAQEAAGEVAPVAAAPLVEKAPEVKGSGTKQKEPAAKKKGPVVPAAKASKAEQLAMEDDFFA
ncbi:hypothetical protein JCM11491_003048 [Sporobolomyces phaffii]